MRTIAAIGCAALGAVLLCFPAVAQQKTVKACQDEWRANKEANQAKGITEKAYVTQCRSGTAAAAPKPAAATDKKPATSAPAATTAAGKTAKECRDEWRANKAANQAKGVTEKAYVAQCRSGSATATQAAPPAPPPAPAAPSPPRTASQPPAASTTPTGANQYSTETQAKVRCLGGTVVWANLDSKIYHFSGHKDYGHTKTGAYMCERDATSQGMRAAKNEKHP